MTSLYITKSYVYVTKFWIKIKKTIQWDRKRKFSKSIGSFYLSRNGHCMRCISKSKWLLNDWAKAWLALIREFIPLRSLQSKMTKCIEHIYALRKINKCLSYMLFATFYQNIDWYFNQPVNWVIVSFYSTHEILWNGQSIKRPTKPVNERLILQWRIRMPVLV